jgi:hypothetical protein
MRGKLTVMRTETSQWSGIRGGMLGTAFSLGPFESAVFGECTGYF